MPHVELSDTEWTQVMNVLSGAPWRDVNMLLLKIGGQLRLQQDNRMQASSTVNTGNGHEEVRHE